MVSKSQIQFHRRSRYEDILELVDDNEEALKPFPSRDAVFYKASNKGSFFDGKDHLDRLKVEQRRINERIVRDQMLRGYATDNDLTHRALWDAGASARADSPTRPQMLNIGSDEPAEQYGNDEFFDTDEDTSFTRAQLEGVLQRAGESQQANQEAIAQAHQQQVEQEQQQGEGILRTLGRGTMRIGRNIAGGLATGQDLTTSVVAGLAEPVLGGLGDAVMRRILPQPRPLLDLEAPRTSPNNPWRTTPNIAQLPPSIVLQPHQPNVGATQQPLPPAVQQPALPAPQTFFATRRFIVIFIKWKFSIPARFCKTSGTRRTNAKKTTNETYKKDNLKIKFQRRYGHSARRTEYETLDHTEQNRNTKTTRNV